MRRFRRCNSRLRRRGVERSSNIRVDARDLRDRWGSGAEGEGGVEEGGEGVGCSEGREGGSGVGVTSSAERHS
jgi:hypothetical protein